MKNSYAEYLLSDIKLIGGVISFVIGMVGLFFVSILCFVIFISITVLLFVLALIHSYIKMNMDYGYIINQIECMEKAETSIDLVIRSINLEKTNKWYKKFDETIETVRSKKIPVRILTYYEKGDSRVQAIENLGYKDIIKFSKSISVENDFRYLLKDGITFVVSKQKDDTLMPSKTYAVFDSKCLAQRETELFNRLWADGLTTEEYLKEQEEKDSKQVKKDSKKKKKGSDKTKKENKNKNINPKKSNKAWVNYGLLLSGVIANVLGNIYLSRCESAALFELILSIIAIVWCLIRVVMDGLRSEENYYSGWFLESEFCFTEELKEYKKIKIRMHQKKKKEFDRIKYTQWRDNIRKKYNKKFNSDILHCFLQVKRDSQGAIEYIKSFIIPIEILFIGTVSDDLFGEHVFFHLGSILVFSIILMWIMIKEIKTNTKICEFTDDILNSISSK